MKQRQIVIVGALAAAFGAALLWAGNRWLAPEYSFSLVYTGSLMGELEPCGCAEETDLGGIRRRATMIDELRADRPDLMLVSAGGLMSSNTWQDQIKAKYILRAFVSMRYDSVGLQWRDLAYGNDFLGSADVRWVGSSSSSGAQMPISRLVTRANGSVAHFTWLDPDGAPDKNAADRSEAAARDAEQLNGELAAARSSGAVTLVSTTAPVNNVLAHIDLGLVDLLVTASPDERYREPERVGTTLVLNYGTRGMRIGRLDFSLDAERRIGDFRHAVHVLRRSVPDAAELDEWYEQYNAEVRSTYRAMAERRKALESGENSFAGERVCAACHRTAHAVWSATKHAAAFGTLEAANKQFDPYCIACHTVGFDKPGGFIDLSASAPLANVQCESCHGAGREHVSSGGAAKTPNAEMPAAAMCAGCHVGDHSPSFALEAYWSRIAHTREPE